MLRFPLAVALAALLTPAITAAAALEPLACKLEKLCVVGDPCVTADEEFRLEPIPGGYGANIDGGWVEVRLVSPEEADVKSFLLSGPQSVTVLLSLYPDGALALTLHEDINGRYVETTYGRCVLETM